MLRRNAFNQLDLFSDNKRFTVNLDENNRWIKWSEILPWEKIEDHYALSMSEDQGRKSLPSRVAFGAIFAKEYLNVTDEEVVQQIGENPYLQYFLGQTDFIKEEMFHPTMMVHFRKRFTVAFIGKVNEYIITGKWPEDDDNGSNDGEEDNVSSENESSNEVKNKGKLILDATVAPSDIRYPNDVSLLAECRENLEKLIDAIWEYSARKGHKLPYNRQSAKQKTNNFTKKKKKNARVIKAALNVQLNYVELAIRQLIALVMTCGIEKFNDSEWDRIDLICKICLQQRWMFDNATNSCDGKILNLRQPHVRAILRNKAGAKYEYGQKLALSKICGFEEDSGLFHFNGYVFIDEQSWNNFNESTTLIESVKNYRRRLGFYPEAVLVDQIYRTRANINYCNSKNIRLSGPALGRKSEQQKLDERKQAYIDSCERNGIEGANGVLKRRYGLDLIMCILPHNAEIEASLQILAMNFQRRFKLLFLKFIAIIKYLRIYHFYGLFQ